MIKIYFISVFISVFSLSSYSQEFYWQNVNVRTPGQYTGLSAYVSSGLSLTIAGRDSGFVEVSTDGGIEWSEHLVFAGDPLVLNIEIINDSTFDDSPFTGSIWASSSTGKISKSTNSGLNWIAQPSGTSSALYGMEFVNLQTGWAAGHLGIIRKTTNGGNSWFAQTSGTTTQLRVLKFYDSNTGWCTGLQTPGGPPILKTTNGGENWVIIANGGTSFSYYGMDFIDQNTGWVCGNLGSSGYIFKTTDGGSTWNQQIAPSGGVLYSIDFTGPDTGYCAGAQSLAGNTGRILKTTNGGINWVTEILPANTHIVNSLSFINSNSGFAACNGSLLWRGVPIGIHPISSEVPANYSLHQNYPNPFNPSTKFKIQIAKLCAVKLVVFDVSGREVETLVNGQLEAGTYEVEWNALNFSSGIYFYQIQAGNFTETKKMLMVK